MQTTYKVLDPSNGLYQERETQESAELLARELAWQFYLTHTHDNPISKVVVTEENVEIWSNV